MRRADEARRKQALAASRRLLGPTQTPHEIVRRLVAERAACVRRIAEINEALKKWREVHEGENHQGSASQEG